MKCTVDWMPDSGMAFAAETGSGHLITMDGAPDGGGRNLAPRPMETVLAGTGACTAYDVVLILRRGRHDVTSCRVELESERATTDPKVFTKIHMHFRIAGRELPEAAVERAVRLSHEKYCSASAMLGKTAEMTTSFEIAPALAGAAAAIAQMRWAVVVITRAASRIAQRTGSGSPAAPACSALAAWPASSRFICSTTARELASAAGRRSR